VLTSIDFLVADPRRSAQAVAAGWDILVVDEAHHLEWSEAAPSRKYQVVDELSRKSEGLLLLTPHPNSSGWKATLPVSVCSTRTVIATFATFQAEEKDYRATAEVAEKLVNRKGAYRERLYFCFDTRWRMFGWSNVLLNWAKASWKQDKHCWETCWICTVLAACCSVTPAAA